MRRATETLGLPPGLTAATGMGAIAHCMETFMAPAFNPPADGIAPDGLARGWSHIERATHDGRERRLPTGRAALPTPAKAQVLALALRSADTNQGPEVSLGATRVVRSAGE